MADIERLSREYRRLRVKYAQHDARIADVLSVRAGDVENVLPGVFPDTWPHPIVANLVDVAARDLSEVIAPMPSLNCTAGVMVSERARRFASKKTKIAHYYTVFSDLAV